MTELDIVGGRIICAGTFSFTGEQVNTYTPVLSADTTDPSLGAGTSEGWWVKFGNLIIAWGIITFGAGASAGSGNYRITLPTPVEVLSPLNYVGSGPILGYGLLRDNSALSTSSRTTAIQLVESFDAIVGTGQFRMYLLDGAAIVVDNSNPFVWADSDRISFHVIYPAELEMLT